VATPPDGPETDWDRDFHRLRKRYVSKLHRQLTTLDEMLREARDRTPAAAPLEAARSLTHRMKGTSGTYGLLESFAAMEQIEEQLGLLFDLPPDPDAAWLRIESALRRARAELE